MNDQLFRLDNEDPEMFAALVRAYRRIHDLELVLEKAQTAIGDWVCTYANDMVGREALETALGRIRQAGGTLAYTAEINEQINAILSSEEQPVSSAERRRAWLT